MFSESPSLFVWSLSEPRPAGFESFLDHYATETTFYGSGKAALHDGLASLVDPGQNALIPAYLPDAVAEPFHDLGLEIRYYQLEENLAPDLADIERRIDDETATVMSVNYFGFPQPGLDEFTALIDEYDCYHIDDNAHAPLSVDEGTLLGTRGHLGVTSLWKVFPIPNGAMLYCNDPAVAEAFEPTSIAGVREQFNTSDCGFVLKSFVGDLLETNATLRRSVDDFVTGRSASIPDPRARYEAGRTPMSKLSAYVLEDIDPATIRESRRTNYRAWLDVFDPAENVDVFDPAENVDVFFETLPLGICPQVFPVRTTAPSRLLERLERHGVDGAHTWPRLSSTVREDSAYETATRLAREVVVLPVHQQIEPSAIRAVGDQLRRR